MTVYDLEHQTKDFLFSPRTWTRVNGVKLGQLTEHLRAYLSINLEYLVQGGQSARQAVGEIEPLNW